MLHEQSLPSRQGARIEPVNINLKSEVMHRIRTEFGPGISKVVGPLFADLVLQGEGQLRVEGQECLAKLQAIESSINDLPELNYVGSTREVLLRDILLILLRSARSCAANPLILRATTCPDYAYDQVRGRYKPEGGIGSNAGLCAETILSGSLGLLGILSEHGIKHILEFAYADMEADDPDMLDKAALTRTEFLERVEGSRLDIANLASSIVHDNNLRTDIRTSLMSELIASVEALKHCPNIDSSRVQGIVPVRMEFYARFYAESLRRSDNPMAFFERRARKDMFDHVIMGTQTALAREAGETTHLLTLSTPALANLFRYHQTKVVPVIRLDQSY